MSFRSSSLCASIFITVVSSNGGAFAQNFRCSNVTESKDHTMRDKALEALTTVGSLAVLVSGKGGKVVEVLASAGLTTSSFALVKSYFDTGDGKKLCVADLPGTAGTAPQQRVYFGPSIEIETFARKDAAAPFEVPPSAQSALARGRLLALTVSPDLSVNPYGPAPRVLDPSALRSLTQGK